MRKTIYPGLFGPQWFAVIGLMAAARDEVLWYLRHRDLPQPPAGIKVYKRKFERDQCAGGDASPMRAGSGEVVTLIGSLMRLRALALRHACVAQTYYASYLGGALSALLAQHAADVSRADPMHAVVEAMARDCARLGRAEAAEGELVEALGLDARRVLCGAVSRIRRGGVAEGSGLPQVLLQVVHAVAVVGGAAQVLVGAVSLSEVYYWGGWQDQEHLTTAGIRNKN